MPDVLDTPVDRSVPYRDRNVLTVEDIAAIFDKPVRTMQEWARLGKLPEPMFGVGRGVKRLWSAAYFFRWLDSNGKARR